MKILNKIALGLVIFMVLGFILFRWDLHRDLQNLSFQEVQLSQVANGTYQGESNVGPVTVEAEVQVKDGKIQKVTLLRHVNGMGRSAEGMTDTIRVFNTWDVDCVTGATVSSQAIRQAVNRALAKGCK